MPAHSVVPPPLVEWLPPGTTDWRASRMKADEDGGWELRVRLFGAIEGPVLCRLVMEIGS